MGSLQRDIATRARLLEQLRRGCNTIEGLAAALGITDNAVRFHIATLERTEVVRRAGAVRDGRVGKPAVIYELTDFGEELQSRAYAPVLTACVEELATHMPEEQLLAFMRDVGLRLATNVAKPDGDLDSKVRGAAEILEALGGTISITASAAGPVIEGHACPLASAVARQPVTCTVIQTLLDELLGLPVTELCEHTERPRCKFLVDVGEEHALPSLGKS
jgi:predicted ArsR family transcriptional regulator